MPLCVLLVDDEPIARKVLREELEQMSGILVIAEAENGAQAIRHIENLLRVGKPGSRCKMVPLSSQRCLLTLSNGQEFIVSNATRRRFKRGLPLAEAEYH